MGWVRAAAKQSPRPPTTRTGRSSWMGSPPTLDPAPTRPPDPTRQAVAGDGELLEHLQTPAAFGGHEFGDWPLDQIAGSFGGDLDAPPRDDHTRLATEFAHTHPEHSRDPVREGER